MAKISVIIPVYNVQDCLAMCMDSICYQSFKDIEIICINDGSTDKSLAILHAYARRDPRVKIIDHENAGAATARNAGIKDATGEYLCFIDSDDWLEADAFEKIIAKADEHNPDVLIYGAYSCDCEGIRFKKRHGKYTYKKFPRKFINKTVSSEDIKNKIFKFPPTAWTKLYNREFIINNNIYFPNLRIGEDQQFFIQVMISAEKIFTMSENLYCYRKNREGSLMTFNKQKKSHDPITVLYGVEAMLKNTGKLDIYKDMIIDNYFSKATSWLGKFDENLKEGYFNEYLQLLEHVKNEYPNDWWMYFSPLLEDSYWKLKLKRLLAKRFRFELK